MSYKIGWIHSIKIDIFMNGAEKKKYNMKCIVHWAISGFIFMIIYENPVLNHTILLSITSKYSVDLAHVVINWATRHGVDVTPASTNPKQKESGRYVFD
eukprot:3569046-Ditylum_brightwellii.AAC.1